MSTSDCDCSTSIQLKASILAINPKLGSPITPCRLNFWSARNRTSSSSSWSSSSSVHIFSLLAMQRCDKLCPLFSHLWQEASLAGHTWRWCLSWPHNPQLEVGAFLFPDFPGSTNSTWAGLLSPRTRSRFCAIDSAWRLIWKACASVRVPFRRSRSESISSSTPLRFGL